MEATAVARMPALDGLRGLAVILVVIGHLQVEAFSAFGPLGVTLFFVLSGFLITGILTRQADCGGVRFMAFYRRRARRLIPALLPMLAVAALMAGEGWWDQTWRALLYVGNFRQMTGTPLGNISHVWSLAVEEHFYLLWPVVIAFIPSGRRLRVIGALVVAFGAWRLGLLASGANGFRIYYGTDTNAFALLAGCLVSVGRFPRLPPAMGLAGAAAFLGIGLAGKTAGLLFASVLVAALVVHVAAISLPILEAAWLRWFGTISYGLYLWHRPLMDEFDSYRPALIVLSVLAAWVSWKFIEQPILEGGYRVGGSWRRGGSSQIRIGYAV